MHAIGSLSARVYESMRKKGHSKFVSILATATLPALLIGTMVYGLNLGTTDYRKHNHEPEKIMRIFNDINHDGLYDSGKTIMVFKDGDIQEEMMPKDVFSGKTRLQLEDFFKKRKIDPLNSIEERLIFN